MEINQWVEGNVAVLTITGRIDAMTMSEVEKAAVGAIGGAVNRLIIDLRSVDYISSAGLRAVLVAAKRAKAAGGGVALFGPHPAVEDVMTSSGFASIVPIAATEAEARDLLGA